LRPERHNAVKLLLFLDVGGSMDPFIKLCEELFSACKTEFKHLEYFYFHNFIYESVWKNNMRRTSERTSTMDLLHKYGADYKVVFVGDAAMAPYEITQAGGSVEHWNEEAGYVWMKRFTEKFKKIIWINPYPKDTWNYAASTGLVRELIEEMASAYQEPEQVVAWYYKNDQQMNEVRSVVLEEQVVDTVLQKANVTDKTVSYEDAVKPAEAPKAD